MGHKDYVRKEYSVAQAAYLAGMVDGDGCIYIGNFSCNPKTKASYYQTNMQIACTDEILIDWLIETFGGLKNKRTPKQLPENSRKDVFIWTASGDRLTHLCELIQPYVITKKRQVEIMLKMRATYIPISKKGKQGVQPHSEEMLALRKKYMEEMRSLHVRTWSYKNH